MNNLALTIYNKKYHANEEYYSYDKLKNGYIMSIDVNVFVVIGAMLLMVIARYLEGNKLQKRM